MYGHVEKLAEAIKEGASSVEGVEAKLWQVGDTVPFIFFPGSSLWKTENKLFRNFSLPSSCD